MLYPVPFKAEHFWNLELQGAQAWLTAQQTDVNLRSLENEWAGTLVDDGAPIACAGVIPYWENRAYVWALISTSVTARNFPAVHRHARGFIRGLPFRRLEAAVDVEFEPGHRWARALGFKVEAPRMRAFQVDGRDCTGYALVR